MKSGAAESLHGSWVARSQALDGGQTPPPHRPEISDMSSASDSLAGRLWIGHRGIPARPAPRCPRRKASGLFPDADRPAHAVGRREPDDPGRCLNARHNSSRFATRAQRPPLAGRGGGRLAGRGGGQPTSCRTRRWSSCRTRRWSATSCRTRRWSADAPVRVAAVPSGGRGNRHVGSRSTLRTPRPRCEMRIRVGNRFITLASFCAPTRGRLQ
jgi:hypothetical protein